MHADLTRWTFDPALGYRSVLMQQGRVLLDAEWNEQAEITAHHDRVRTEDIVGPAGGAEPADGGPGPFALVALPGGGRPDGAGWADLAVTPGRYYVDGVLAAAPPNAVTELGAWPLANQPHLRTISSGVTADPGLTEPGDDGRYAAWLEVFDHLVTADERPQLLESALGGPDTAAREQTVWQVRLAPLGDEVCSELAATAPPAPRRMVAALREADDDVDPCRIVGGGGYQRLENQLYRVEVFDAGDEPRFVWSRENGSVVAGLLDLDVSAVTGADAALTIDRPGRDEELSIGQGDLVEVTSADRRLRGLPGFLAVVEQVGDLLLHVAWDDGAPTSVAALGSAPVVRRWDGGPTRLRTTSTDLEGGITVRFPAGGTPQVGDHWLIPARTARLGYGVTARLGTLEWPWDAAAPAPRPPNGPDRRRAPLGILVRAGGAWTLESDCRRLFPPLTRMVSIDLVGGDGQEAMPGDELDEPVRVVVRNGGIPVGGAPVRFTADGGTLREAGSGDGLGGTGVVATGSDGVAAVLWTPDPGGETTQTLAAVRLDDTDGPSGTTVVVTGRLSVARQVAWDPVGEEFADTRTVQEALERIVARLAARTPGLHVTAVSFLDGEPLVSDVLVPAATIASGIVVELDGIALPESVTGKPVGRLLLDVPWPTPVIGNEFEIDTSFATQTIILDGTMGANGDKILWRPADGLDEHLDRVHATVLKWQDAGRVPRDALPMRMRFQLDGWAIVDAENPDLHLNGQAAVVMDGDRSDLRLPTTDEVTGGRFESWFWFGGRSIVDVTGLTDLTGRTRDFAERRAADAGLTIRVVEIDAPGVRGGTVVSTEPVAGTPMRPGDILTVRVSRGVNG